MGEGSTLRFTVDIAADEADGKLKALTSAFDAVGVRAKGSFLQAGRASRQAGQEVGGLLGKLQGFRSEQMQQARQARFLAGEIMSIVPAGGEAGNAIRGLTGLLVEGAAGGLGFGLAFEAIKFALTPLIAAFNEEREAAAKAKAENDQVFTKLISDADAAARAVQDFNSRSRGLDPEALRNTAGARDLEAPIRAAKARLEYAQRLRELEDSSGRTDKSVADWDKEIAAADKAYTDLVAKRGAFLARASQLESQAAAESAEKVDKLTTEADAKRTATRDAANAKRLATETKLMADLWKLEEDRASTEYALETKAASDRLATETKLMADLWKLEEEEAARATEDEKKQAEQQKQMVARWASVGESVGTALGNAMAAMATGSGTAMSAMKALAKTVLETMKSAIISYIAGAKAAAAFAEAGIPVIGPAMAVAGVAAMAALLGGLLSELPSAATGWDRVPFDMPVMVHRGERITTKYDTDRMDRLEAGGGGTYNITVTSVDAKSVERLFKDHQGALIRSLADAMKKRRTS